MAFLKVLSYSLMFIASVVPTVDKLLPPGVLADHYDIKFILNINDNIFYGECNISGHISYETQNIYVYTENLFIIRVTIVNDTEIFKEIGEVFIPRPNKIIYNTKTYITTISFPFNLSLGTYTLNMKFTGLLAEDGGFKTFCINNFQHQQNRVWLAATHYYKFATRRLFPLLKDTVYASYNISIKHHKNYTALSNMPVQEVNMDENNMQWTRFKTTPAMPVYFVALIVGHFGFILDTTQNVKLWCGTGIIPHMIFAYTVVRNIAQYLEKVFPYVRKSPETNHIAIPTFHDTSDEENINLGFVFHREEDIIFKQKIDSEICKIEIARIIGYKVVHEWFYNAIDPSMWEPWLNKGFITFFGIYAADKTFPHFRIQDLFVVQMQHEVLHWATKGTWPLIIESEFNYVEIPHYIKASIMFRTLQILLTEEMFEFGMKSYLRDYASSKLFWDIMQSTMDKSSFEIKYNVTDRIASWTRLNHYPVINVKRNYNNNSLNISVENFNTDIWIFVNITTQTYSDSKKLLPAVWLAPNISNHILNIDFIEKNDWILANLQQSGCYRVSYDADNWNRLSNILHSNAFEKIHVLDRAKIIDDAFHFSMTGRLNSTVFLDISHYLSQDTDYIAWYPMFKNLEYMSGFFAFPESAYLKMKLMYPLSEILWVIKYPYFKLDIIQESAFTTSLRKEAARWLCTLSHDYCLSIAKHELKLYLINRNTSSPYKIWTGWKEWTFCNGLKIANNYTWIEVFYIFWNESDNSVLKFLPCSQSDDIILRYIHMMRIGVYFEKATILDYINAFTSIIARHAKNNSILDTILNEMDVLRLPVTEEISIATILTMIINHVYSMEQINKIKKYVEIKFNGTTMFFLINYKYPDPHNTDEMKKYWQFEAKYQEYAIIYVKRKLKLRWNQIQTQAMEFRDLAINFDNISMPAFED